MNEFFKVLADETRLRCLALIFENEEICVCEIMHALDLPQSKISRHLSIIKLNNVISQRREGQWVLYSKEPTLSEFKANIIQMTINELSKTSIFAQDKKRLSTMKNRPVLSCCK